MIKENIKKLLHSDLSANQIQGMSGINRANILRMKKGEIDLGNITLDNALKLNKIWEEYKMEIVKTEFIEGFEKDMEHVVSDGDYEYVLSKVTFGDRSEKFEVSLEIDGLGNSDEPKYFETEEEARDYIKNEL